MFDIGFLELFVVLIIALLVIGPERMPEVARKIGRLTGKIRHFIHSVKQDTQVQETLKDFKESVNLEEQQQQINQINHQLRSGLDFNKELNLDELQRPNFGGTDIKQDNTPNLSTRSQFNQAPNTPHSPLEAPQKETQSMMPPSVASKNTTVASTNQTDKTPPVSSADASPPPSKQ